MPAWSREPAQMGSPPRAFPAVRAEAYAVALGLLLLTSTIVPAGGCPSPAAAADSLLTCGRQALWSGQNELAADLLRLYVTEHPGHHTARLDLARAAAWSGRYPEAARNYEIVIDRTGPGSTLHADALEGLAHVYAWTGRNADAITTLDRLLAIHPTRLSLRARREELASRDASRIEGESAVWNDSSRLRADRTEVRFDAGDVGSRAFVVTAFRETLDRTSVPALFKAPSTLGDRVEGGGLRLGARSHFGRGFSSRIELGSTRYGDRAAHAATEARLEHRGLGGLNWTLRHSYGDRGFDMKSFEARDRHLAGHEFTLSGYRPFGFTRGAWALLRYGSLDDRNSYRGGSASFDQRLWEPVALLMGGSYLDYSNMPGGYYAPRAEWTANIGLILRPVLPILGDLRFDLTTGRAGNSEGAGNIRAARASWDRRLRGMGFARARFGYDESIRRSTYISREASFGLGVQL